MYLCSNFNSGSFRKFALIWSVLSHFAFFGDQFPIGGPLFQFFIDDRIISGKNLEKDEKSDNSTLRADSVSIWGSSPFPDFQSEYFREMGSWSREKRKLRAKKLSTGASLASLRFAACASDGEKGAIPVRKKVN